MPDIRVQDEQGIVHVFPDGSTPEMIAKAMNVKPPRGGVDIPDAIAQARQQIIPNELKPSERAMQQTMGGPPMFVDVPKGSKESFETAGQKGYATGAKVGMALPIAPAAVFAPGPTALALAGGSAGGYIGSNLGEAGARAFGASPYDAETASDVGGALGGLVGGVFGPKAFTATKGVVGNALRTPYGPTTGASALKPGVKAVASIGKYFGGPELADWMVPERSAGPTGPYSKLQSRLPTALRGDPFSPTPPEVAPELGSPENPGWMSKIPTRMPKPISTPAPSPFAGATPSNVPTGNAELPPTTGAQTPFPVVGKASTVTNTPKIVSATAGEPGFSGSEGRAATWTNEAVQRLAQQGNREAISQAIRRGMELPPGARYIMGDPDFSRAVYNPREVTQFTPEGTPIRNKSNPIAQNPSAKARIATPFSPAGPQVVSGNPYGPQDIAYRAHTAGTPEIDVNAHAHATASPQEAAQYAASRNEGVNQKVSRIDLRRFKPGEVEEMKGPNGDTWYKFNRPLTQADYLDEQ